MNQKIEQFANGHAELIANEQDEVDNLQFLLENLRTDELESLGYALVRLKISNDKKWVTGKAMLTLQPPGNGNQLPRSTLRSGEMVELVPPFPPPDPPAAASQGGGSKPLVTGVIQSITDSRITVAMDNGITVPKIWRNRCSIKVRTTDINQQRMLDAITKLKRVKGSRPDLHRVLFGEAPPRFDNIASLDFFDNSLNAEQRCAVNLAVSAREIALIHGPPGTGKTHTLVEVVRQLVAQGKRLLVCGPSNVSVDNLAERVGKFRYIPIVRIGHPARIRKAMLTNSLNSRAQALEGPAIAKQRKDLKLMMSAARMCRNPEEQTELYARAKIMRKTILKHTDRTKRSAVSGAKVVFSTLCGAGGKIDGIGKFDVVIIDESTQSLEGECWIAASKAPKLILAGDHHQLPPTLKSHVNQRARMRNAAAGTISSASTMFERVRSMFGDTVCYMLTTQYRMHFDIMKVPSEYLYESQLVAHSSVTAHVLSDMSMVRKNVDTATPLVLIDTAGADIAESFEPVKWVDTKRLGRSVRVNKSKINAGEAQLAIEHVARLISSGLSAKNIAIISPYSGQVRLLKLLCKRFPAVEIGSVDGFQGCEKEAVILSLVRSNENGEIGFLSEYRRINVAVTRARRHLCMIADSSTIDSNRFLGTLVNQFKAAGKVRAP
ncbi:P-loop containing nucleoside triphosphate hydrolase protein [Coemansia reversa NRRL 1564]|uniref:DNA helicase n=1 Tax=Coemansia reversa (strain ATCC 12441 / NRRL 1564) TaxID=763665 RepID=A0A2G5BHW1_COERN|nr:P-loop containing nucleoside triphosphate hydrolase protein [Coemansia reversa NRRL 1564]|eukprot:PIA18593.1 P-loop containing nucleoside triphosphate hydrolase protein [Coemansia reversa NRRL 1564]